jgi:hypothetical protein
MTDITKDEKTLIYELLGVFQGGTFDWYDYNDWTTGEIASVPIHEQVTFQKATDRLEAIIAAINAADAADGRRARISEVLIDYAAMALETARIGPGGAGGAAGLEYSPTKKRERLRTVLQGHLGIRVAAGGRWMRGDSGRAVAVAR